MLIAVTSIYVANEVRTGDNFAGNNNVQGRDNDRQTGDNYIEGSRNNVDTGENIISRLVVS